MSLMFCAQTVGNPVTAVTPAIAAPPFRTERRETDFFRNVSVFFISVFLLPALPSSPFLVPGCKPPFSRDPSPLRGHHRGPQRARRIAIERPSVAVVNLAQHHAISAPCMHHVDETVENIIENL